jgi:hypothetical protein
LESGKAISQTLEDIRQDLFISKLKSLTGQVDAFVQTAAIKRLERHLELTQLGDLVFRRLQEHANVPRPCCTWFTRF